MSNTVVRGFCQAGCAYRVPTYDEFLRSASMVEVERNEDGTYALELGVEYKVVANTLVCPEGETPETVNGITALMGQIPAVRFKINGIYTTFDLAGLFDYYHTVQHITFVETTHGLLCKCDYKDFTMGDSSNPFENYLDESGKIILDKCAEVYKVNRGNEILGKEGKSVHIRYSASPMGEGMTEKWSEGQTYIGQAVAENAPTNPDEYEWSLLSPNTDIVNELGDDPTKAISQKTVTDEINLIHTGSIVPINAVWENGQLSKTGDEVANDNWVRMTEFEKVRENAELYILSSSYTVSAWVCEYDASMVCLGRTRVASFDGHYILQDDCVYIRVALYSTTVSQDDMLGYIQMWYDVNSISKLNDKIESKMIRQIYPFDNILIKSINHRGFNRVAPENTLPAYRLSAQKGFPFVETDLNITSDGVWVLLHDDTIDRTSNGTGNITEMTFEQVRSYDFGSWKSEVYAGTQIPTLEEFLVLCRNLNLYPYLELKSATTYTQEQINALVAIVKQHGMEKAVSYISFNRGTLQLIANASNVARIGLLWTGGAITQDVITKFKWLDTGVNQLFVDMNESYVTNEAVELCKSNELPLEVYCPNVESNILNEDDYITGFTSDELIASEVIKNANIGNGDGVVTEG